MPKKAKDEEGNKLANIEQHATNYLISGQEWKIKVVSKSANTITIHYFRHSKMYIHLGRTRGRLERTILYK